MYEKYRIGLDMDASFPPVTSVRCSDYKLQLINHLF